MLKDTIIATTRNVERASVGMFKEFIDNSHFRLQELDIVKKIDTSKFPEKSRLCVTCGSKY